VTRVFLSLGSNIRPELHLKQAVEQLRSRCRVLAVSPVYETRPIGPDGAPTAGQPNFLNAAVLIETDLDATTLKSRTLRPIEEELGRERQGKFAPRTIDLDIILFGSQVLDLDGRHIPDPNLLRHAHIARPLADLEPAFRHPEAGRTLAEIAAALPHPDITPRPDVSL